MKLLVQKRADILKFARFVQNSVRNYQLLEITSLVKNVKKTATRKNILTVWLEACYEFVWSIISKELRFAVLDTTSAKQPAPLGCCLILAPVATSQLSFCFKMARIFKKLKLVQVTARNWAVAWNWRQNALPNRCFSWNWCCVLRS